MVCTRRAAERTRHSRRAFLAGIGGLVLFATACTTGRPSGPSDTAPAVPHLTELVSAHENLLTQYDSAIAADPALSARLTPLRANVGEHAKALRAAIAATSPASSSSAPPPAQPLPAAQALVALAQQHDALHTQIGQLIGSVSATYAPLLGSIAACHFCQSAVLKS